MLGRALLTRRMEPARLAIEVACFVWSWVLIVLPRVSKIVHGAQNRNSSVNDRRVIQCCCINWSRVWEPVKSQQDDEK